MQPTAWRQPPEDPSLSAHFQGEAQGQLKVGGNAGIDLRAISLDGELLLKSPPQGKDIRAPQVQPGVQVQGLLGLVQGQRQHISLADVLATEFLRWTNLHGQTFLHQEGL